MIVNKVIIVLFHGALDIGIAGKAGKVIDILGKLAGAGKLAKGLGDITLIFRIEEVNLDFTQ